MTIWLASVGAISLIVASVIPFLVAAAGAHRRLDVGARWPTLAARSAAGLTCGLSVATIVVVLSWPHGQGVPVNTCPLRSVVGAGAALYVAVLCAVAVTSALCGLATKRRGFERAALWTAGSGFLAFLASLTVFGAIVCDPT